MAKIEINVRALADLARLEITDKDAEKLQGEIPAILGFVDTIQNADVSTIDRNPPLRNVMREDVNPHEGGKYTERILKEAPKSKGQQFVVSQVVSRKK